MKKRYIILLLTAYLPLSILPAQTQKPTLLTTIRVEDALGNVDSVEIGFDPAAVSIFPPYNLQLGEEQITAPWDSVFEVRTTHGNSYHSVEYTTDWLSKRNVSLARKLPQAPFCYQGGGSHILIRAIHWPVTISWDQSFFSESYCSVATYMTPDLIMDLYDASNGTYWHDVPGVEYTCLADTHRYVIDLSAVDYLFQPYAIVDSIGGMPGSRDTIYGVVMVRQVQSQPYSPCQSLFVATEEPPRSPVSAPAFRVAPNPTVGRIQLDYTEPGWRSSVAELRIFDTAGRSVRHLDRPADTLDLSDLPAGVYSVVVRFRDGSRAARRVVVTR